MSSVNERIKTHHFVNIYQNETKQLTNVLFCSNLQMSLAMVQLCYSHLSVFWLDSEDNPVRQAVNQIIGFHLEDCIDMKITSS